MKRSVGPARRIAAWVAGLGLMIAAAACSGEQERTVEVLHPPAGAEVQLPFEVTVDAGVQLGSPADGMHHVHIWFGDDLESYLVVETATVRITNAPVGETVLHVSLRQPDHSAAGAETSVPLVISAGAG